MLAGCAFAEGGDSLANPWVETDAEGVMQRLGVEFGVPENAEDITYYVPESANLAEMRFIWDGMRYIARMKPTAEFEDISGLCYDAWD